MILTALAFELHATGSNTGGKLGLSLEQSTNASISHFVQMNTSLSFASVTLGTNHVAAITNDSKLYMWGRAMSNSFLSVEDKNYSAPVEIDYFTSRNIKVKQADPGALHTVVLGENGNVYLFGDNSAGQLGKSPQILGKTEGNPVIINKTDLNGETPIQIGVEFYTTFIITENGSLYISGACRFGICGIATDGLHNFTKIELGFNAKRVFIGTVATFVESDKGEMYASGNNSMFSLCLPENKSYSVFTKIPDLFAIKYVSSGKKHSIFVTVNNTVLGCGYGTTYVFNNTGEPNTYFKTPKQFIEGTVDSAACTNGGTLYTKDGVLYATGEQYSGELGYADNKNLSQAFTQIYFDKDINTVVSLTDYTFGLQFDAEVPVVNKGFPWWGSLAIAVGALLVVVVVYFIYWKLKGHKKMQTGPLEVDKAYSLAQV